MTNLALFKTLPELEAVIRRGLATFVEVGDALLEIRDSRLYHQAGYTDFDAYCRERWGWHRAHAYRLMEAATVVKELSPMGDTPPPTNERQARELARIPDPAVRADVWREVAVERGVAHVTAERIRETAERHAAAAISAAVIVPDDVLDEAARERIAEGQLRRQFAEGIAATSRLVLLDPERLALAVEAGRWPDVVRWSRRVRLWLDHLEQAGNQGLRLVSDGGGD